MRNKYDALLFDMDGVLVDVTQSYRKVIQQTASYFLKRKVNISEVSKVKNKVGMNNDWDATYKLIDNITISYNLVKNKFQEIYLGTPNKGGLIDNEKLLISKKQLEYLKEKYNILGIVTGRPKKEAKYTLEKNKLSSIFNIIIAMEDTKRGKPFPDSIQKAIKILKTKNPVYIGDSLSDVAAAGAAGIPCIFVGNDKLGNFNFLSMKDVFNSLI